MGPLIRLALLGAACLTVGCADRQAEERRRAAEQYRAVASESFDKGQLTRAAAAAELAAQYDPLDPTNRDLAQRLALAAVAANRPSVSLDGFTRLALQAEQMEKRDPGFAHVYQTVRAMADFAAGNVAEARLGLETVTVKQPGYAAAWVLLGEVLSSGSDPQAGVKAFETAYRLEPANPRAISNLGKLAMARNDPTAAVEYLNRALAFDDSAGTRATLGSAWLALGKPAEAVPHLERAVAALPQEGRYRLALAEAVLGTGQPEKAERLFREAATLGAEPGASRGLATLALQRKDFARARELFVKVLAIVPDDTSSVFLEAEAEEGLGNRAGAAEGYRRFITLAEPFTNEAQRVLLAKDRLARLPVK